MLLWRDGAARYLDQIAPLVGTVRRIRTLDEIRPAEWDCLLAVGESPLDSLPSLPTHNPTTHISIIAFIPDNVYNLDSYEAGFNLNSHLTTRGSYICNEFLPVDSLE